MIENAEIYDYKIIFKKKSGNWWLMKKKKGFSWSTVPVIYFWNEKDFVSALNGCLSNISSYESVMSIIKKDQLDINKSVKES